MRASSEGHVQIMKMLLDFPGIEVNSQNKVRFITRQQQYLYVCTYIGPC